MALVRFAPTLDSISGSFGAAVFSKNSFGSYLKEKTYNNHQATTSQLSARNNLKFISQLWATLSSMERTEWETFSEFYNSHPYNAPSVRLNGRLCFLELNLNLLSVSCSPITRPVWESNLFSFSVDPVYPSPPNLFFTLVPENISVYQHPLVSISFPQPLTINNISKKLYNLPVSHYISPVLDCKTGYEQKFGALPDYPCRFFVNISFVNRFSGYKVETGIFHFDYI